MATATRPLPPTAPHDRQAWALHAGSARTAVRPPRGSVAGVVIRRCPASPAILRHAVVVMNALYGDGLFPARENGGYGEFQVLLDGVVVADATGDRLPSVEDVRAAVREGRGAPI